jgi:methanogenic corrinoid protein MtbC1
MADLKRLQTAVEVGDRETAVEVTQQAIEEEIPPKTVLDAMTDAMGVVGQRFQDN